jgi:hypothetical protein
VERFNNVSQQKKLDCVSLLIHCVHFDLLGQKLRHSFPFWLTDGKQQQQQWAASFVSYWAASVW